VFILVQCNTSLRKPHRKRENRQPTKSGKPKNNMPPCYLLNTK